MNVMEERISKIEGIISQMNERLNHIGNEVTSLRSEISDTRNSLKSEITSLRSEISDTRNSLRSEISGVRNWMFGILIPMWVTIIIAVIFR